MNCRLHVRFVRVALLSVYVLLAFLAAPSTHAEEAGPPPLFDYRESTLANGLRVVTLEDFSSPIVAVHVWYHVGSKNEDPCRQGFAHMFEHMMFRGTELLGPEDHFNLIRGAGGSNNAFTSFDYTAYVNEVPSNQLDLALWLEAERMMFLNITQEGFEKERAVVEEERREHYLNVPYGTIPERVLAAVVKEHPYRWLPIGRIAHLEAADIEELQYFWDHHYVPANATLVIVGAVPHDEAKAAAERYFGWMPALPAPAPIDIREPEQKSEIRLTVKESKGPIPVAVYAYRGLDATHPDTLPLEMTLDILATGESSRMHKDLVRKRKLCALLYGIDINLEQDGVTAVGGAVHPVRWILGMLNPFRKPGSAIFRAMDQHVERVQTEGVTDRELEKVKNQMRRSLIADQLTVSGKARDLGSATLVHGSADWLNQQLAAVEAVTAADLQRAAQTYLTPERRTRVTVLPDKKYKYDPNAGLDLSSYKLPGDPLEKKGVARPAAFPKAPPLRDVLKEMPEFKTEEKVLANGLRVIVIPNHEVPFTAVALGLPYGAFAEDPACPGVAVMTLDMLTKGTENYDAEELAEAIEFDALSLHGSASRDMSMVVATALKEKLPAATALLAETVLRPTFPKKELRLLKRRKKVSLRFAEKEPSYQANRELRERLFGDHPYARALGGTRKEISGIKRQNLIDWWQAYAQPEAAVLYIAGDVTPEEAFALAEEHLGAWKAAVPLQEPELPPLPEQETTHIYLVDLPDAVQSEIRVGQLAFGRDDPDYIKAKVFSQIYGGSFGSRINKTIRIEKGLTYGAWGGLNSQRFASRFLTSTSTKPESTAEAVQAILDVIKGMATSPATAEELTRTQSYLAGRVPRQYETFLDVANALWFLEYTGLPQDHFQQALAQYADTRAQDVTRIASRIDTDHLTIIVAGNADQIRADLEAIAPVTVVE